MRKLVETEETEEEPLWGVSKDVEHTIVSAHKEALEIERTLITAKSIPRVIPCLYSTCRNTGLEVFWKGQLGADPWEFWWSCSRAS